MPTKITESVQFRIRDKSIDSFIPSFKYYNYSNFKPHSEKKTSEKKHIWKTLCPSFPWHMLPRHKKRKERREGGTQRRKITEVNQEVNF